MKQILQPGDRRARRGHGRPTLHDVASVAAVTRITVSRFLRSPEMVALDTAARIQEAIATTGYVPNLQAGHLASGRSKVVVALIPTVNNSIFAETIQALSEGLNNTGYELLLASTAYDMGKEESQLRALLGWDPAAVVVTGRQHSPNTLKLLKEAQSIGTPVIGIWDQRNKKSKAVDFPCIGFSHADVGRAMAKHLLERGHLHLAYVLSSVLADYRAQERGDSFAKEVLAAGARLTTLRAGNGDPYEAGRLLVATLMATNPPITAVGFSNDNIASGALVETQRLGISVPKRLSLIGFGDFPIGRMLSPSLSTLTPPRGEIGQATAQAVLHALANKVVAKDVLLPWHLQERASTDFVLSN